MMHWHLLVLKVIIYNRQDCCSSRLNNFQLSVGNAPDGVGSTQCIGPGDVSDMEKIEVLCPPDTIGRYVRIYTSRPVPLTLCEVEVLGSSAKGTLIIPLFVRSLYCLVLKKQWKCNFECRISPQYALIHLLYMWYLELDKQWLIDFSKNITSLKEVHGTIDKISQEENH